MNKVATGQRPPATPAEYEAAIEQCIAEMERLQALIDRDQAEIDRLNLETRAIPARMKAA